MDLSLGLEKTHVIVTGGNGLIGRQVVQAFLSAGANVSSLDVSYPSKPSNSSDSQLVRLQADTTSEERLTHAWQEAESRFGTVQVCVALAALDLSVMPKRESFLDITSHDFKRTIDVNITGTFNTAKQWLLGLARARSASQTVTNASLIIVGSESGHWGEPSNADYATSKAAVQSGLLQSLRQDAPRIYPGARVNAIAPGPVNTSRFQQECQERPNQYYEDCVATTGLAKPVEIEHVARSIIVLASDNFSGSTHGQIVNVDCGKVGKLVHHKNEAI